MAYKMSKGKRGFGDIEFEDDADTGIDFSEDIIDLQTSGSVRFQTNNSGANTFYDPTSLGNNIGVGDIVKFGSGTLTTGKVYYLNGTAWAEADADAVASGADQMLGIALGSNPSSNGLLIRGFVNAHSYLTNFSAGKAVYISTTSGGIDTIAPNGSGDFVRIVGYCTTTANVIYFNPSTTWIEL